MRTTKPVPPRERAGRYAGSYISHIDVTVPMLTECDCHALSHEIVTDLLNSVGVSRREKNVQPPPPPNWPTEAALDSLPLWQLVRDMEAVISVFHVGGNDSEWRATLDCSAEDYYQAAGSTPMAAIKKLNRTVQR